MNWKASISSGLRGGGTRRFALFVNACLAAATLLLASTIVGAASATGDAGTGPCYDGFRTLQQTDNSFSWQEQGLPFRSVSWSGVVR
ncbi:MAG TPA: hypothetical protein VEM95_00170, partial [Thermoplasmata archaeon]|nr:hypothetical protein [Thermoplasmata archaeon]